MRESDRERALRLLELDPEEGLGAPRSSLLRRSAALRRALSAGRWPARARRLLAEPSSRRERARLLLRLGLPDAAAAAARPGRDGEVWCGRDAAAAAARPGRDGEVWCGRDAAAAAARPGRDGEVWCGRDAALAELLGEALTATGRDREACRLLSGTRSFWGLLWLAEASRRAGRPAASARALAAARRLRPRSPWPHLLSGRADRPAALERAVRLSPREPWALLMRGWRRLEAGRFAPAEADLSAGLRGAKDCKWALVLRARARLELGRPADARADLEAALALDPDLGVSVRAWRPGERRSAELRGLDRAISARPGEGWLRAWRGQLLFDALRPEPALADLRAAVALEPSCGWARAFLARAESLWLGAERAQEELARAFADAPACAWILLWRGLLRARRGDGAGAGRDYAQAARRHPSYALARGALGGRLRDVGDLRGALAELDAAAELDPDYGFHFERRRRVLRRLGLWEAAFEDMALAVRRESRFSWAEGRSREALERARADLSGRLAAAPGDADALAWRGETLLALGDAAGARADLDAALRARPGAAWPRAWRAELLLLEGAPEAALAEADAALARDSSYARAWGARARALTALGRRAAAVRALGRVVALDFGAAWAYAERGRLLLESGRRAAAAADLARAVALDRGNEEAARRLARAAAPGR